MKKPNRNDPCSCGSGKKYKKCCGTSNIGRKVTMLSSGAPLKGLFEKAHDAPQSSSNERAIFDAMRNAASKGMFNKPFQKSELSDVDCTESTSHDIKVSTS